MIHQYERLLTTYAYNILGSYEDARDVVQDAYLNFMQRGNTAVEDTKAYLVRSVINLSINKKNKQKREKSLYPGEWLPEPIATEKADSAVNRKEILSYTLLVLLEQLNAKQRAVFILKEAFAYDHAEIASVLGITEEHSRKLLSRAKEQLKLFDAERIKPKNNTAYVDKYLAVIQHADMQQLEKMLHDEIVVISDGGGKAVAFRKPVAGRKSVVKLLLGVFKKFYAENTVLKKTTINHEPALCYYENGKLVNCQIFSLRKEGLHHVYFIRNPDKLKALEKNLSRSVTL
ncbi:sigma-70 family RNA polymerase sigma factor [Panacibacter ginsenosidivorans]|uniref:Sigma-70 family RNA polymerase sigma factor n=1 Tax=Panacibacter ginsenosidivorans TaxID=1813871 RepID=A0A5B8VAX8_9BACT|nr:sigma-70 family RNA polymerase sigma factor [Panacibacter ginsenosidivorans]QEC67826.1 sigma-70 family RNA polymerase sigma factor [Panacibacter ginsenosidivorans]